MTRTSRFPLAVALALGLTFSAFAGSTDARVRVVHASPDAPPVDVWVNGSPAIMSLAFEEDSGYAELPAALYDFEVVPAGSTGPVVIDLPRTSVFYNTDYTVVAVNTLDKIEPLVLVDENRPVFNRSARVRFVHASPDAPAVDIGVVNGPNLFENVEFKGVGDYVNVPSGTFDLEVRVAGTDTVALALDGISLRRGATYTVFATGQLSDSSLNAIITEDVRRFGRRR